MAKKPINRRARREIIRVNERIRAPEVRVIYKDINAIVPTRKAIAKAKELGLDLVEVAGNAKPPVCRIVDYGKWRYEQSKQKKDKKAKIKEKEIKFRVRIDDHDYHIKMRRAEDFLAHGYKLRIILQFRGRENAYRNLGFDLMQRVREDLLGMGHIDLEPKLNNRSILMMLSPLAKEKQKPKFRRPEEEVDLEAHDAAEAAEAAAHAEEVPDDDADHLEDSLAEEDENTAGREM